jgi:hypothetical protein
MVVPAGRATALSAADLCSLPAANPRAADGPELRPRLVWPTQRYAARVDAFVAAAIKRDHGRTPSGRFRRTP